MEVKDKIIEVSNVLMDLYSSLVQNMRAYAESKDIEALSQDENYGKVRTIETFVLDSYVNILLAKGNLVQLTNEEKAFISLINKQKEDELNAIIEECETLDRIRGNYEDTSN